MNGTELFITGGSGNPPLNSVEFASPITGSRLGPSMPINLAWHCMVSVNETTIMVIGGFSTGIPGRSPRTFLFNLDNNQWSNGPDLNIGRSSHSCAMVHDQHDGLPLVIVTGGWNGSDVLDSYEIWNPVDNHWFINGQLTKPLRGQRFVSGLDGHKSAILLGGSGANSGLGNEDSIYKFKCQERKCIWTLMKQKLKLARGYFVAMPIPKKLTSCH